MAIRIDPELIELKVQLIKDTLGKDFISESHNQAQSDINIVINNRYSIYKCVLLSFEYEVDKNDPSKFTWFFN